MADVTVNGKPTRLGWFLILLVGSCAIFGTPKSFTGGDRDDAPARPPDYRVEAFAFSQFAVGKQLKSPRTAKFAGFADEETIITDP